MSRPNMSRNAKLFSCLLLLALAVPAGSLADDCEASTEARLEETSPDGEIVRMTFWVGLTTPEDCAKILVDLIIEEQLPNGQTKKVRKPNLLTLQEGSLESHQRYEMPRTHELLSYESKIVSCTPCAEVP